MAGRRGYGTAFATEPTWQREMQATTFTLGMPDGVVLLVYRWLPEKPVKAVMQMTGSGGLA
jgi:hypothetical protein